MNNKFSKDDRLGYAINHCIGELEQVVKNLPKGATEAEITQTMRLIKIPLASLMSECKKIEDEIDNHINMVEFANNFFKARREA